MPVPRDLRIAGPFSTAVPLIQFEVVELISSVTAPRTAATVIGATSRSVTPAPEWLLVNAPENRRVAVPVVFASPSVYPLVEATLAGLVTSRVPAETEVGP